MCFLSHSKGYRIKTHKKLDKNQNTIANHDRSHAILILLSHTSWDRNSHQSLESDKDYIFDGTLAKKNSTCFIIQNYRKFMSLLSIF